MEKNICGICKKSVKEVSWIWQDEPAHKHCIANVAEYACDDMNCFTIADDDDRHHECECGEKFRKLTYREKKALAK